MYVHKLYIVETSKLHHKYLIPTTDVSKYKWFVYACMYEWIVFISIKSE